MKKITIPGREAEWYEVRCEDCGKVYGRYGVEDMTEDMIKRFEKTKECREMIELKLGVRSVSDELRDIEEMLEKLRRRWKW